MFVVLATFMLVIITIALLWLHWHQTRSHFAKLINQFPHLPMVPLVGHVIKFSRNPEILFPQMRQLTASFDETFMTWSAYLGCVNIITADDAEIILTSMKHINKGIVYEFMKPWLGDGLLISTGSKWQHRRKLLTPTFHFNILHKFVEVMGENCNSLNEKIRNEECEKSKSDVLPLITHMALQTICETAMGTKLNEKDEKQSKYIEALHGVSPTFIQRIFSPWFYNDYIFSLSSFGMKQNGCLKTLHSFSTEIIKERDANFNEKDVNDFANNTEKIIGTKKKRLAMLDLLLFAKKRNEIDFDGIAEEVDTFMFEGHDTTTMGISLALMELAHHKDIQEKIIEELDHIFGNDNRAATYEDLQNMKYLELCIKESLRLYPSVPLISRVLKEDTQLTNHVAPANSVIVIHIYSLHRDPKVYPDPEKFDPDHFLTENCNGRHPYAYIPFSAGPRNCIGQKFAILEMKSVLSSVFRNFTLDPFSTPETIGLATDLVLRPNKPVFVKFNKRHEKL